MAMINKFKGVCGCGRNVPAGGGTCKKAGGKYVLICIDCSSPVVSDTGEACDAIFDRNMTETGSRWGYRR